MSMAMNRQQMRFIWIPPLPGGSAVRLPPIRFSCRLIGGPSEPPIGVDDAAVEGVDDEDCLRAVMPIAIGPKVAQFVVAEECPRGHEIALLLRVLFRNARQPEPDFIDAEVSVVAKLFFAVS